MDFSKLTREDLMVFLGGLLLFIGLLAFPWYSVGGGTVAGIPIPSYTATALDSPYAIWGILALIVTIAILADAALERFSPQTQLPTTQLGRGMTRVALCALMILLLFIKFVAHVGDFGWGFYLDIILAAVLTTGVWLTAQGKATPLTSTSTA